MPANGAIITSARQSFNWYNFGTCTLLAFFCVVAGYFAGIIGTTLGKASFLSYMHLIDADGNPTSNSVGLIGATTGVFQAGGFFGVVLTGFLADYIGRKKTSIFLGALGTVAHAINAASQNIAMFIATRFFTGMVSFGILVIMIVYVAELSPAALRGLYVGFNGAITALGYALSTYIGVGFFHAQAELSWRMPLAIGAILSFIFTIVYIFVPDSPRNLLLKGHREKSLNIMLKQHGRRGHEDFARAEFFQMEQQIELDASSDASWKYFFTTPTVQRRIVISCILAFLSQSTGNLVINNYGALLYKSLGYGPYTVVCLQAGYITLAPVFNVIGSGLSDVVGRRKLLLIGFGGCMCTVAVTAAIVAVYAPAATNKAALAAGAAMTFLFMAFYGLAGDVCVFVIISEIYPNHLRAKGSTVAMGANTLTNLVYLQVSPTALANIGWKYFLVFVCVTFCGLVWIYFIVPETKGIALEELAELFGEVVAVHAADIVIDDHEVHLKGQSMHVEESQQAPHQASLDNV